MKWSFLHFGNRLTLWLLVFGGGSLQWHLAQESNISSKQMLVRSWDAEDGMPQSTGRWIAQTPDGFIWAGTFNGLVRFDGVGFEVFNTVNTPELPENDIYFLLVDSKGRLWIQTNTKGVVLYEDGRFSFPDQPFEMLNSINMAETSDGVVYAASTDGVFVAGETGFVQVLTLDDLGDDLEGIYSDGQGGLFVVAANRLLRRTGEGQLMPVGFESKQIKIMAPDVSGAFWIFYIIHGSPDESSADESHLVLWDETSQEILADYIGAFSISMAADPKGGVWIGDHGMGVSHYTSESKTTVHWNPPLPEFAVGSLFVDHRGRLWIGSDGGGIAMAMPQMLNAYTVDQGLPSNNIITIGAAPDGRIIAGTYYDGLSIQSPGRPDQWEPVTGLWTDNSILSILTRRDGSVLLAGSLGTGLFDGDSIQYAKLLGSEREMTERRRILARLSQNGPEIELPGYRYRALMESSDGALWIGTRHFGAYRVLGEQVEIFDHDDLPNLGRGRVNNFVEDKEQCVWIGTSAGLNRWLPDGTIEAIGVDQGLPEGEIQSIGMDSFGHVLVGTAGSGLGIYDGMQKGFRMLTIENGLPNEVVAQIIEDDFGYLWLGTNAGLCRLSLDDLNQFLKGETEWVTVSRFGRQAGMEHPECTGGFHPSCYKDQTGRLWFSTVGGMVTVDPSSIQGSDEKPTAHIGLVRVGNRKYAPLESSTGESMVQYEIQPNPGILDITYTGLSYDDPMSLRFQYRLYGYDRDWVDVGNERVARYPNLPPGRFQFELRVRNHLGIWNAEPEIIGVTVLPAWWETRWFQGAALGLVVFVGYGMHRYRIQLLQRANELHKTFSKRIAQLQEQDRKRIASDLHDTVAQELLLVRRQTQRLLKDPELPSEHRTCMEGMEDTTRSALDDLRNSIYMLWPRELEDATPYEAVKSLMDRMAQETGIRFVANVEALSISLPVSLKIHLFRIIQEAMQNIAKHSQATEVTMHAKVKEDVCQITIQDNGKGMIEGDSNPESYGLATMKYRANWINGVLTLDSELGHGVRVQLRFPLP